MNSLLIMAAGNGSRYGALKQFDKLGPFGEYLFEFSIFDALEEGFQQVVVVTKKEHVDDLFQYLRNRIPKEIELKVIPQKMYDLPKGIEFNGKRVKPWGTAHAVWVARNVIHGPFVVINADDYYGRKAMASSRRFINEQIEDYTFGMVPYSLSETLSTEGSVSRAICEIESSWLSEIVEYKEIARNQNGLMDLETGHFFRGDEATSMNLWILKPGVFQLIEEDLKFFINEAHIEDSQEIYIPKQIQIWIYSDKAQVKVTENGQDWFGVTYANDKAKAKEELNQKSKMGLYPSPLWNPIS